MGNQTPYYCIALQGGSGYNICINCDLTVSCNCQDYEGMGQIGDLRENTFEQIFRGRKAQSFREALARGEFPVPVCRVCGELRKAEAPIDHYLSAYQMPIHGIMAENTCLCNLHCLCCHREAIMKIRRQHRMSLKDVELVARILKQHGIRWLHYFNLGEPFISPTILEEMRIIREINSEALLIATSTNGKLLDIPNNIEAALLMDQIYFSVDGGDQKTVAKYQKGADFDRSYRNMKHLVEERDRRGRGKPVIEWKYVVFSHNDKPRHIERATLLAAKAKVDVLSFWQGGAPEEMKRVISKGFPGSPYFKTLGNHSWKGREIDFRQGDAIGRMPKNGSWTRFLSRGIEIISHRFMK